MKSLFLFVLIIFGSVGLAKSGVTQAELNRLVSEYYVSQSQFVSGLLKTSKSQSDLERRCPPDERVSCIDIACKYLPQRYCDHPSEIEQISQMCRGVEGNCLDNMCTKLPSRYCDHPSEIEVLTKSCKKVFDSDCVKAVCEFLPDRYCDHPSEMEVVANMCQGRVEGDCVRSICSRLPERHCDHPSELEDVTKSCRGTE